MWCCLHKNPHATLAVPMSHIPISLATPDQNCSLNQLRDCLHDIFHWMTDSKLKLNTNKTEFLIIGTQKQRAPSPPPPTPMVSQNFTPAVSAWNLGVTFDNNNNFRHHISQTCHGCFYYIHDLSYSPVYVICCCQNYMQLLLLAVDLIIAIPISQYSSQGHLETSTCAKLFGKGSYPVSSFLSLSTTS